jgi:TrwC relaxase.
MLTIENIKDINYLDKVAREEYLTIGGEPPGVWFNGEAIGRRTGETIKKGELPRVLSGQDADGNPLLTRKTGKKHRPGVDAVFAAPKSVSVAWALADDDTRKLISKLGRKASETLQFLSDKGAALARRGKSGTEKARLENVKLIAGRV